MAGRRDWPQTLENQEACGSSVFGLSSAVVEEGTAPQTVTMPWRGATIGRMTLETMWHVPVISAWVVASGGPDGPLQLQGKIRISLGHRRQP